MAITVKDLIEDRQKLELLTAKFDEPIQNLLSRMLDNNYSQLPVVDDNHKRLIGIISVNSILKAIQIFDVPFHQLRVSHAAEKCKGVCHLHDELSDIFERVKHLNALIVVDNNKDQPKPIAIISADDLLDFYHGRAENLILVSNIESSLKEHIESAIADKSKLTEEINKITDGQNLGNLTKSIKHYESLKNNLNSQNNFDQKFAIENVFEKYWSPNGSRSLESLSLDSYIKLLLCPNNKDYCSNVFNNLDIKAIEKLLHDVRKIRNDIFHFRRLITTKDYQKLRFCSDWLARHPANSSDIDDDDDDNDYLSEEDIALTSTTKIDNDIETKEGENTQEFISPIPTEEKVSLKLESLNTDNRYSKLINDLTAKHHSKVVYSFRQIESIIEEKLPQGAREDRSWWSNHESQPWVKQKWHVLRINMLREIVTFVRRLYAKEYSGFFTSILSELNNQETPFLVRIPYQDGRHYTTVTTFPPTGESIASLTYSFNDIHESFRIELFINKNDDAQNKSLYDQFYQKKDDIERQLNNDGKMMWERADTSKASRISLCYNERIVITNEDQKLDLLKIWAKEAIISFYNVLIESYQEFTKNNSTEM